VKKLYQYEEDFGRMGCLTGRLLLSDEERAALEGQSGYADDVLGKHSEVEIEINPETLTLVTADAAFLARAAELGVDLECGFDPRGFLNEEEIDEDA
jgi:hypothetical protein